MKMRNKNKQEGSHEVLECRRLTVIFYAISMFFTLAVFLLCIINHWGEKENRVLIIILGFLPLVGLFATIYSFFYEEKYLFDYDGFLFLKREPITGKETRNVYQWCDIKYMKFSISGVTTPVAYLQINYRSGNYDSWKFPLALQNKFIKLAIKYSGRNNIVRSGRRKRKMYEKDW